MTGEVYLIAISKLRARTFHLKLVTIFFNMIEFLYFLRPRIRTTAMPLSARHRLWRLSASSTTTSARASKSTTRTPPSLSSHTSKTPSRSCRRQCIRCPLRSDICRDRLKSIIDREKMVNEWDVYIIKVLLDWKISFSKFHSTRI